MRVLFVTPLFQPEPNHLKGLAYARAMRDRGFDFRVLTGFPNYPGGEVYPGYRIRLVLREELDGVPVTRVAMFPSHDRSAVRRAATYLSFATSASLAAALGRFRPDVVHAYVGPMTLALPASVSRLLRGSRTLLDIQDLWPESVTASGMAGGGATVRLLSGFCRWAYRRSDRFVVLSKGYKRTLCARGVPSEQIDVVFNWCDESQVPSGEWRGGSNAAGDTVRVLYAGNVGTVQALDVILDAARLLSERGAAVEFVVAGNGVELARLQARQVDEAIGNVRFLGRVSRVDMARLFADADALLVHLRDDPLSRIGIPQKTQMSLAVGRPVLLGVRGDAADLVEEAEAGFCFEPESPLALANAVERLGALPLSERQAMGDRGRQYYRERMSFARGVAMMADVYRRMGRQRLRGGLDTHD